MANWHYIYLSKSGGTELDRNGWRELTELCSQISCTDDPNNTVYSLWGGRGYDPDNQGMGYATFKQFQNIIKDDDDKPLALGLYNLFVDDTLGEHFNCHYVRWSDDYISGQITIDMKGGIKIVNGYTQRVDIWRNYREAYDNCYTLQDILDGAPPNSYQGGSRIDNYATGDYANVEDFTIYTTIPLFLRVEDAQNYVETGEKINCITDIEPVEDIGSANNNKYCQTHIMTMDANGHNKNEIHNYYYTYKMPNTQNIVGYVRDDSNDLNVRFKAKNNTDEITIENMYTGMTRILTGANFNNFNYAGDNEYWYGCSTKREHELFGGKICWATFGRMNIYIFDSLAKANDYLETGDPTLAINYDDIDEIPQRASQKTGEDAGDQKTQNNALVEGWEEPSLSNVYILNATKMKQVAELVFPNVDTAGELPQAMKDLKASLGLYGENPINDIIDVWHCPINPSPMVGREQRNLIFGSYRSNITGTCVTSHGIIKNLGATVISPIFNDFRDYEMEIVLYLPYFGTVDLPCDVYMGKQIDIKATIDLRSHNLRYYIFTNNTLMEYHDCAIGTSYPLMGQDVAGKASQTIKSYNMVKTAQRNATISAGMSVVNGAIGLMTGNFNQVVQSGANVEQTNAGIALQKKQFEHDVKYTQPPRSIVGSSSPSCSENDIPYPYIVFKIPQTIKPPLLQQTYGLPSNIVTRIGDVSGYAQIENVQLQSSLPLRIQADILNKLANGVVIN